MATRSLSSRVPFAAIIACVVVGCAKGEADSEPSGTNGTSKGGDSGAAGTSTGPSGAGGVGTSGESSGGTSNLGGTTSVGGSSGGGGTPGAAGASGSAGDSCVAPTAAESCYVENADEPGTATCLEYYTPGEGAEGCGELLRKEGCPREPNLYGVCIAAISTYYYADSAHADFWASSAPGCTANAGKWCP